MTSSFLSVLILSRRNCKFAAYLDSSCASLPLPQSSLIAAVRSIRAPDLAKFIALAIRVDRSPVCVLENLQAVRAFNALRAGSIRGSISGVDLVAARANAFEAALGRALSDFWLNAAMPQLMINTVIHSKMVLGRKIIEVLCIIVLLFLSAVNESSMSMPIS